jgi:predicted nucleic acid-binding protein
MVSYSNSGYTNDFFDVSGIYFNSTSQGGGSSSVDLDELDARYLQKTGGTVSSNLIVSGSVDVKTALTIPTIGNVGLAIQGKQNTINDDDLTIARTAGLQTALEGKQNTINDGDLTIARTAGLQTALEGKQNTINDDDLTIARTAGLQSALNRNKIL